MSSCPAQTTLPNTATTERWLTFDSWQCSAPLEPPEYVVRNTRPLASYYLDNNGRERILVLSNWTGKSSSLGCTCRLRTWVYRIVTNSWSLLEAENGSSNPEQSRFESRLITLCRSTVLYITASQENKSDVWKFNGKEEIWSKKSVSGLTPPSQVFEKGLYALRDCRSGVSYSCECLHIIIGFGNQTDMIWKMVCNNENGNYCWERMNISHNKPQGTPSDRKHPNDIIPSTICAGKREGILLTMSNSDLWKYSINTNLWYYLNSSVADTDTIFNQYMLAFYSFKDKLYVWYWNFYVDYKFTT